MSRHTKSPERLKEWRLHREHVMQAIEKAAAKHENEMRVWIAQRVCAGTAKGDWIVCPDGKPREVMPRAVAFSIIQTSWQDE